MTSHLTFYLSNLNLLPRFLHQSVESGRYHQGTAWALFGQASGIRGLPPPENLPSVPTQAAKGTQASSQDPTEMCKKGGEKIASQSDPNTAELK